MTGLSPDVPKYRRTGPSTSYLFRSRSSVSVYGCCPRSRQSTRGLWTPVRRTSRTVYCTLYVVYCAPYEGHCTVYCALCCVRVRGGCALGAVQGREAAAHRVPCKTADGYALCAV